MTWSWNPWVVGSLILLAGLYLRGRRALRHTAARERGVRHREGGTLNCAPSADAVAGNGRPLSWAPSAHAVAGKSLAFWSGWCALGIALVSPLHALGAVLFSAHMIQHEVLMLVAGPLLVLGRPLPLFLRALPLAWRRQLGKWGKNLQGSWQVLTHPLVVWTLHAAALWIWHLPRLFQATLTSELAHAWQHLSFFGTALCFWWALLYGHQKLQGYGVAVLAVFTTALHSSLLGALLTFAPTPWYPAYAHTTAAWGLTSLEDQQLSGLIMWIPAGGLYLLAALTLGAGWLRAAERQVLRQVR